MRWRRRCKATRRCRRSTSAVRRQLAARAFCGTGEPLPGHLASARAGRRERLVVVVGAACANAGSEHGVVHGAGNYIQAEGAVALAAALQGNTTLQTLDLSCMWTARTRAFCGNGGPLPGHLASARARDGASGWRLCSARRARVRAVEHGVVHVAVNGIKAEGAVALAAALQGNTTLQTLHLNSMSNARKRVFFGNGGPLPGHLSSALAGRCENLVVVVGAACESAGSEHGVVRGAGNDIEDEGAVALAAALRGNTTLQTLDLGSMWTARSRVHSAGLGNRSRATSRVRDAEARAAGGCGRRGVRECGQLSTAWCMVQSTTSKPRAPLRWRRRSKATRRCGRYTSAVCRPLASVYFSGMGGGRSRGPRECAGGETRAAGGCGRRGLRECGQ